MRHAARHVRLRAVAGVGWRPTESDIGDGRQPGTLAIRPRLGTIPTTLALARDRGLGKIAAIGGRIMIARSLAALGVLAVAFASPAAAQTTTVNSTPVVIHAAAPGAEGVVTERSQIILRQRATTIRAVVLNDPIARPSGSGRQRSGFEAGEKLFGIYDDYDSWAYCALRDGFFADSLTCYQDTDDDGRFDIARPSGAPFLGVPFFIFAQNTEERRLATPASYTRIPYSEGPAVEAGLQVSLTEPRRRRGEMQPGAVRLQFGYIVDNRFIPVSNASANAEIAGEPVTLEVNGARVEFSGPPERDQLRYRVIETIPSHITRVRMTRMLVRTTTYVPIYIPR